MREGRRVGRPRSVSRDILEEAACELFLERGYAATSVADITQRAGVSRNTFFNYIPTKSDLLWTSVDEALDSLAAELEPTPTPAPTADSRDPRDSRLSGESREAPEGDPSSAAIDEAREALLRMAATLEPGTVVLALANAEPMGVTEELEESAVRRQRRTAAIISAYLRRRGLDQLSAAVIAAALAGAFLAALAEWARSVPGRTNFSHVLGSALDVLTPAGETTSGKLPVGGAPTGRA